MERRGRCAPVVGWKRWLQEVEGDESVTFDAQESLEILDRCDADHEHILTCKLTVAVLQVSVATGNAATSRSLQNIHYR